MTSIAIIGAGISGITTAYALIERGYDVTILDRHRYPAMETSFANGGQLSVSNAEVWTKTDTILQGIRWALKRDAPLLFNPFPTWHKYSWLAEFVGNIPSYRINTIETVRLALASRQELLRIAEAERIAFDLERRGILHIYDGKKDFEKAQRVNRLLCEAGLDRREVGASEIKAIEPALTRRHYGGFFTPSDATGDIHMFTRGLAEACVRKGAQLLLDADVCSIVTRNGKVAARWRDAVAKEQGYDRDNELIVDGIVICAGVESRRFAAIAGDRVNIYPVKGYSITVNLDSEESQLAAPNVSLLDEAAKIVTSRLGRYRFRVAGTAEFNGFNRDIRADRILPLIAWVRHNFPAVDTSRAVPWSGLRPMMPSMLPVVRRSPNGPIFYNTGHGHLGWTLSAATAQMVADLVELHDNQ